MNKRILKKLSKRVAPFLISQNYDLSLAKDNDESLAAIRTHARNEIEHVFITPMSNTLLHYYRICWETPEYDCKSAWEIAVGLFHDAFTDWSEYGPRYFGPKFTTNNILKWVKSQRG